MYLLLLFDRIRSVTYDILYVNVAAVFSFSVFFSKEARLHKLDKYDKSRNIKMSTFITMCIRNDMIKYLNKERKNYEIRPTKKREPESPEDSLFLKDFCDKYDGHTKDVLKLKLIGETNKDIGKKLGISQRAVKVAIDKVKKDI